MFIRFCFRDFWFDFAAATSAQIGIFPFLFIQRHLLIHTFYRDRDDSLSLCIMRYLRLRTLSWEQFFFQILCTVRLRHCYQSLPVMPLTGFPSFEELFCKPSISDNLTRVTSGLICWSFPWLRVFRPFLSDAWERVLYLGSNHMSTDKNWPCQYMYRCY
jgi:hypothetical protein